jgi:elongator complex protein 3
MPVDGGLEHDFDPFAQVRSRIMALSNLGHPTDKIELLILGGTWSSYKRDYQEWFVQRCLDAMNVGTGTHDEAGRARPASADLEQAHAEWQAAHRNVGLGIETRPDRSPRAAAQAPGRDQGAIAQSPDDGILAMNNRGTMWLYAQAAGS